MDILYETGSRYKSRGKKSPNKRLSSSNMKLLFILLGAMFICNKPVLLRQPSLINVKRTKPWMKVLQRHLLEKLGSVLLMDQLQEEMNFFINCHLQDIVQQGVLPQSSDITHDSSSVI